MISLVLTIWPWLVLRAVLESPSPWHNSVHCIHDFSLGKIYQKQSTYCNGDQRTGKRTTQQTTGDIPGRHNGVGQLQAKKTCGMPAEQETCKWMEVKGNFVDALEAK